MPNYCGRNRRQLLNDADEGAEVKKPLGQRVEDRRYFEDFEVCATEEAVEHAHCILSLAMRIWADEIRARAYS